MGSGDRNVHALWKSSYTLKRFFWYQFGQKRVTETKRRTRDAVPSAAAAAGSQAVISLPEVSWMFLLVVLFVAVLHGDALHPSFPD